MAEALRSHGVAVVVHALDGPWPWPGDDAHHTEQLSDIPGGSIVVADGLLWPGLQAGERAQLCERCTVWVVVHSLIDMETPGAMNDSVVSREMDAIAQAYGWFATSQRTAKLVASRLNTDGGAAVVPGTSPAKFHPGSGENQILSVATVTTRKGHSVLLEALSTLTDLEWRLDVVGSLDRDPNCVRELEERIEALGLRDRVRLVGELDESGLDHAFASADLLVHAASFEAFGMGLTEALARGVPVVSTPAGALDSIDSIAVDVVPAGDIPALADSLRSVLQDPQVLAACAEAARQLVFPDWTAQADRLIELLGIESVGFSIDWLRQREPYDHGARSGVLVDALGEALGDGPHRLMEIATGLGSGTRFVSPRLRSEQSWVLVDHDPQLLGGIDVEMHHHLPGLNYRIVDHDLRNLTDLNEPADAVLTQALLDLASQEWLVSLADWLADRQVPFLASLTVDGRVDWSPTDPRDTLVQKAFRAHQTWDRGFGASPGPQAAQVMEELLVERGFRVRVEQTDWVIPPEDVAMMASMLDGIAWAASEASEHAGVAPDLIAGWYRDRKASLSTCGLRVGHVDLLAVPDPGV
jgi:glycosyltransferase involved in cell wall biosynthesis